MKMRHQGREAALQVLYFWQISGASPTDALNAFFEEHLPDSAPEVQALAEELVFGTVANAASLDAVIEKHSEHWRLERLAIIDRLILRMAIWEMQHHLDVPAAVVIDEAIELARTFSSDDSVRFVNGMLDAIRKTMEGYNRQR